MVLTLNKTSIGFAMAMSCLTVNVAVADSLGVHTDKIVVGQSAAFDGPAKALGLGMRAGLQAAFHEVNEAGGVNGRKIELISLDDGYEPERAIANTRQLINEEEVFALIGAVGTPTSKAALPITQSAEVPFFGPFTGAGFLRDPSNTNVVNVRGTYDQETEAWIHHLTEDLGLRENCDPLSRRLVRSGRPGRCAEGAAKARIGTGSRRHLQT